MEKTIKIDGIEVKLRSDGAIPMLYQAKYHRDIIWDMAYLREHYDPKQEAESHIPGEVLLIFAQLAHVMARHADKSVPNDLYEWLEGFSTFSIYQMLPVVRELWDEDIRQHIEPQKK